jgi:penicillin-binding protein 2
MRKRFTSSHEISLEEGITVGTSESDYLALPASREAFFLIAAVAVFAVGGTALKAGFLNVVGGTFYTARANANVSREIVLPTRRAEILARGGEVLAKNANAFSIFLNIQAFLKAGAAGNELIAKLAPILGLQEDEIKAMITGADFEKDTWIPIARTITLAASIEIKGLISSLGTPSIIRVVDDFEREYTDASVFSSVVGYTGVTDGNAIVGKSGLEYSYDAAIRGEDGKFVVYEDARGNAIDNRVVRDPKPAPPLQTTIDAPFERYFYERFRQGLTDLGRSAGTGIALDPRNGEVLALVSFPSFDANIFVDPARRNERENLLSDAREPLFNRALSGLYSPGSTIKPLVALAALQEGVIHEADQILSKGALEIPNPYDATRPSVFLDWKAHGWVNVVSALARSSNIYFYIVGGGLPYGIPFNELIRGNINPKGLGIDRLKSYWEKFGFGSKTNIDLPFEAKGFLPDPAEKQARTGEPWRIGDSYNASIGQGDFLVTPIELAAFIAAVGNGGKLWKPHLLLGATPELTADYSSWSQEFSIVRRGLEAAVSDPAGSSHILSGLPVSVAGKTGTPQIANKTKINALFMGYAPTDNPAIAILVLIENAKEGSVNALPIAKDVMRWYYEHRIATAAQGAN